MLTKTKYVKKLVSKNGKSLLTQLEKINAYQRKQPKSFFAWIRSKFFKSQLEKEIELLKSILNNDN